jgi:hypothetical protein
VILAISVGLNWHRDDQRDPRSWASDFVGDAVLPDGSIAMRLLFDRDDGRGLNALNEVNGLLWWAYYYDTRRPRPPGYVVEIEVPRRTDGREAAKDTVLTVLLQTERLLKATNFTPDFNGRLAAGFAYTDFLEVRGKSEQAERMFADLCRSELYRDVLRHICHATDEAPLLAPAPPVVPR